MLKPNQLRQLPQSEKKRLSQLLELEKRAKRAGYARIAGVDEAGRGPLAGPVVAAACLFEKTYYLPGINDSKLLTPLRRRALYEELTSHPDICFAISVIDASKIDQINILQATLLAMQEAVLELCTTPDYLFIDGNKAPELNIPLETVVKGDQRVQAIAAASILAKEHRDELMQVYHRQYPEYGFDAHKGYGTKRHLEVLKRLGPCPIHRMSFAPVQEVIRKKINTPLT